MKPICPICQSALPRQDRTGPFPFCSWRCKKLDLYRWLNEEYRISEPVTPENVLELEVDDAAQRGEGPN